MGWTAKGVDSGTVFSTVDLSQLVSSIVLEICPFLIIIDKALNIEGCWNLTKLTNIYTFDIFFSLRL